MAYAFDRDFDSVAGDHRSDALGSAGCDQVSRFEGHDLRNVTDHYVERENKILRVAGLPHIAIHPGFDLDAGPGIEAVGDDGSDRAEGIAAFGAGPLTVFVLQIAGGEIIYAGVAEDVVAYVIALGEKVAAPGAHAAAFTF